MKSRVFLIIYTIDFEANNDTTIDAISGGYGATIAMPTDPVLDGYTFTGWYTDEECTVEFADETFTSSTTVYAGWEEIIVEEEEDYCDFFQKIANFFIELYQKIMDLINSIS